LSETIPFDRTHGGSASADLLDFSANPNPLGPPAAALEAYRAAESSIARYPEPHAGRLAARIAEWAGVNESNVLAGNGTTQLLYLVARVLRPSRAHVVIPTFSEIANSLASAGCNPRPLAARAERGFAIDFDDLRSAVRAGADAVFVGRPNSPTGFLLGADETIELARECARRGAILVIDEAYIDFAESGASIADRVAAHPDLIVFRSLTKTFAIPGLRLGAVVAAEGTIARLRDAMEPWSVNAIADAVGQACLENAEDYLARTRAVVAAERNFLSGELRRLRSVQVYPSAANFLMLRVGGEPHTGWFGNRMRASGIAIRDLSALPGCGASFYRIAARLRADNRKLVEAAARELAALA
jgi:threonine-phosphate decarboxylase